MTTLNDSLLSKDLDHIISQRSTSLTGVLPASISSITYSVTNTILDEEREVEINGIYALANAEFSLNATKYANLPSVGSILQDSIGNQYKVLQIDKDEPTNPILLTFVCNKRHSNT